MWKKAEIKEIEKRQTDKKKKSRNQRNRKETNRKKFFFRKSRTKENEFFEEIIKMNVLVRLIKKEKKIQTMAVRNKKNNTTTYVER